MSTIETRIDLQSPQSTSEAPFRPSKASSFYGSNIAPPQLKFGRFNRIRVPSTDVTNSNSREQEKRPRRDYEIFRDEEKKEIIASCPELMSDYDERVFRAAAKAMFHELDKGTKALYKEKAEEERKASCVKKNNTAAKKKPVHRRKRKRRVSVVAELKEEQPTRFSPRLVKT